MRCVAVGTDGGHANGAVGVGDGVWFFHDDGAVVHGGRVHGVYVFDFKGYVFDRIAVAFLVGVDFAEQGLVFGAEAVALLETPEWRCEDKGDVAVAHDV